MSLNPVIAEWTGPFGGVPPFDQVKVEHFKPGIEQAMAEQLNELDRIAQSAEPPTFDNTIAAIERTGQPLARAMTMFGVWSGGRSTPDFQAIEAELSPKLAEHGDRIIQNAKLFARVKAVHAAKDPALTAEQERLTWHTWNQFERQGAGLSDAAKKELSALNQELARLTTQFSQNLLGDEEHEALVLEREDQLAGLSDAQVSGAAAEAKRRGLEGKWVIANTRSAMEPFLTTSTDRALREKAFTLWTRRGDLGNARDNNRLATQILRARAKKAKLLGHPTYAHWKLGDSMAKTPEATLELMTSVWTVAREAFKRDVAEAQKIVDAEGGGFRIAPWDYRYYAEKLRKQKYDLDFNELKPYLQLERIREAMFWVAGQLYGLAFTPVEGLPVFDPQMRVYEVQRGAQHVGLWYFDPYARAGKQSGAWMSAYRDQQRLIGPISTIVSNNSNFIAPSGGEPVTISWDDARTMFHEFGHALHGLNSSVTYPALSGTNTTRDFVEFPSQFHEHYLVTPQVLKFLVNARGEPIPEALLARIEKARTFNEGFATAEAQASAIVDMKLHLAGEAEIDPRAFEAATLKEIGMPPELVMRHRIPHFGHIFSGEGYSAGYYSYLWAEVLDHDAWEAFTETGNPFDQGVAERLQKNVMSVGNTVDPAVAFKNFRGRDPKPEALLRHKGFSRA
jgi:peptidyl-dipeptidase Dcp